MVYHEIKFATVDSMRMTLMTVGLMNNVQRVGRVAVNTDCVLSIFHLSIVAQITYLHL